MSFTIGENVGPYRITAQVGSGGMATVYKAYHAALDRYVAIKVLHPAFKEDPNFLARFQREARIVAKLEHSHIVPVYDFNEHQGQPYLVMRFVEGETLKSCLRTGRQSIARVMEIMRPVCQALIYAHEQGVLHRDIKPSNILMTPGGGIFLTDFGLARMAQAGESTLTRDTMVGTPQYISPEQARGQSDLDVRTDIYSLGVVLYELLVGRVPFQADTPYAVVHDHIFTPLPMPRSLNPDLPEPLERVLLKALAKERNDRYAAAADMLAALEKAVAEVAQASTAAMPLPPEKPASPVRTPEAPAEPDALAKAPVPAAPPLATDEKAGELEKPVPDDAAASAEPKKSRRGLWFALGAVGILLVCCCAVAVFARIGSANQPLQTARELRDAGRIEEALAAYDAARQENPKLLPAYTEPAQMLVERGRPEDFVQAAELYEQGLGVAPDNAVLHMTATRIWLAIGEFPRVEPHLQWLIEHKPDEALTHAAVALVALERGEMAQAQAEAERALEIDPDALESHFAAGLVFARLDRVDLARLHLEQVVNSPDVPPWVRERAMRVLERLPGGPPPPRPSP